MSEATAWSKAGALRELGRGFVLPLSALRLIASQPRLLGLSLAVAAVTFLSLVLLAVLAFHFTPALVAHVWEAPHNAFLAALHALLTVIVGMLLFLTLALAVPPVVTAPFQDPLSIGTERALGIAVREQTVAEQIAATLRALKHTVSRVALLLAGQAVLFLLAFIPVAGGVLFPPLGTLWAAVWLALQFLDVPMARHGFRFRDEVALLRRRPFLCLGFGLAVDLLLWIPVLNVVFVPVAVVAATQVFRGLVEAGDVTRPA